MRGVLAATALVMLATSLAACGSNDEPEVPPGWMGVLASPPLGSASFQRTGEELKAMRSIGVESVRFPFYWREAEPTRGGRPRWESLDRIVSSTARARLRVLPTVVGAPRWARRDPGEGASPPRSPSTFARFMARLVGRYGPRGSFWRENRSLPRLPIRDWQLWNEPDHRFFWADQPYYAGYARLLRAARGEVKRVDPGARVVLAGLVGRSWVQLERLYRAGAGPDFDVAAVHPFTKKLSNVMRIVDLYRGVMRRHGDADKPMVVTEVVWPSSRGRLVRASDFDVTEREQARLLTEAYRELARRRRRQRIAGVYWATWATRDRDRSDAFDYAGLSQLLPGERLRRKPAFFAYRSVSRELAGG